MLIDVSVEPNTAWLKEARQNNSTRNSRTNRRGFKVYLYNRVNGGDRGSFVQDVTRQCKDFSLATPKRISGYPLSTSLERLKHGSEQILGQMPINNLTS